MCFVVIYALPRAELEQCRARGLGVWSFFRCGMEGFCEWLLRSDTLDTCKNIARDTGIVDREHLGSGCACPLSSGSLA